MQTSRMQLSAPSMVATLLFSFPFSLHAGLYVRLWRGLVNLHTHWRGSVFPLDLPKGGSSLQALRSDVRGEHAGGPSKNSRMFLESSNSKADHQASRFAGLLGTPEGRAQRGAPAPPWLHLKAGDVPGHGREPSIGPEPGAASAALHLDTWTGFKMEMRIWRGTLRHGLGVKRPGKLYLPVGLCILRMSIHSKWAAPERRDAAMTNRHFLSQLSRHPEIGICRASEARQPLYFPCYARPVERVPSGLVCSTTASEASGSRLLLLTRALERYRATVTCMVSDLVGGASSEETGTIGWWSSSEPEICPARMGIMGFLEPTSEPRKTLVAMVCGSAPSCNGLGGH